MKKIWEFYENMNELVYVADLDTYELIYMNRYGIEKMGFSSLDEVIGKPCYEIVQKCTSPCAICTKDNLKAGEFYEWEYENPLLRRTYMMKDTVLEQDGRRYRMEIAIDKGLQDKKDQDITEYRTNEAVVNDALRLALSAPTPENSLEVLLQYIGESLKSERIYIFEENEKHTFDNTYEWCEEGVTSQKDALQGVPMEAVELWYESFRKNENVIIKDLKHIRETDPKAYEYLEPQDIDSLVVSPLVFHDKIIGFYGVDNPPKEMLDHISIMFMVLGHFIVSILRRRDLVKSLQMLSYFDQLTGALNRHGMNEFIANVDHNASIGIIYFDVMGLKKVNDTLGHLEGDALLKRAYQCLLDHFDKNTIFRIGGDEFLVMGNRIPKEEIEQRVAELEKNMSKYDVDLAFGWVWQPKCNGHIKELLKEADRRMYESKRKYYEDHPEEYQGR